MKGEETDENYLSFICSLDELDEPFDHPAVWPKTNPSLPLIPGTRYLEDQIKRARGMPSKRSMVERLQFCIWAEASEPWIDRAAWIGCEDTQPFPDDFRLRLRSSPSYLSLDLSKTTDLSALCLVTDLGDEGLYAQHWAWTPADTLAEREKRDKVPYSAWVDLGYLSTTPGPVIEYEEVALRIAELCEIYDIRIMCYDAYRIDRLLSAAKVVRLALTRDVDRKGLLILPHSQGWMRETKKTRQ